MAAKEMKKAALNLSCPVCFQVFKNPKYLPCYHSYCEQCLEKMVVQSKITCPECRKEATIPAGGVKELANNFLINRLVDELIRKRKVEGEEEVKCENCEEDDPVVTYCPDCSSFLCHVCNEVHKRAKLSRGHGVIPLTELRSSKRDSIVLPKCKIPMCKKHSIELLFFCKTCEELMCMYCIKEHAGHEYDTVDRIAGSCREELQKATAPIEEMVEQLCMVHEKVDESRKEVRKQGEDINKEIDRHYNDIMQKIMRQKDQLKQQVCDLITQSEKTLTTQLEEVEFIRAEVLSMKELKDTLEQSSDQEALSTSKQVIDQMQWLVDKYKMLSHQPIKTAEIRFVPSEQLLPQFGDLGNVKDYKAISDPYKIVDIDDGSPWGIAFSSTGFWAVSDWSKHCICLFNDQDQLITRFGGQGRNRGHFHHPTGVTFDNGDHLYVADRNNHRVQKFDINGNYLLQFGSKGCKDGELNEPRGILAHRGKVYIADHGNSRVSVFQTDGQFHSIIGRGILGESYNIAVDSINRLFVTDRSNDCISTFTLNGQYLCRIGIAGTYTSQLKSPYGIAIDPNGFIFVTDDNQRVSIFDKYGKYVHCFGSRGHHIGQFRYPLEVAFAANGYVYIADFNNHRIQIFSVL
ncbi:tripartite motif-containing protein 2-like [Dysidea avara]|uniref:tripartite motif-containing protein 2-like n=1 Tax=Dysidea avara TaxID=196820 RepID=UPI00332D9661